MTSMDQARAWARKAGRAALVIAPLALAVASANAAVVFNPNPSGSCAALPAGENAPNGVAGLKCSGAREGLSAVSFVEGGTGSGMFEVSSIPFTYDFTVFGLTFDDFAIAAVGTDYSAEFVIGINDDFITIEQLSGSFGEANTGSFDVFVPNGVELSTWSIALNVFSNVKVFQLKLLIPGNSLDLNRGRVAAVPEPTTVALFGAGLLALAAFRRRS